MKASSQLQRPFSTSEASEEKIPDPRTETAEERKVRILGDNNWGIKYDESCMEFQRDWEKIADEKNESQRKYLNEELSEAQKAKVQMLSDKVLNLTVFE